VTHNFQFSGTNATDALFTCATCGAVIGFNLPGIGEPAAIDNGDGTYSTPENPEQWSGPCTQ
jgi:hypothetical protein